MRCIWPLTAVQFVLAVDTVPHTVTKDVTVHTVSLVEVGTLELAHFAYVFYQTENWAITVKKVLVFSKAFYIVFFLFRHFHIYYT